VIPLAHFGHWWEEIVFAVPMVGIVIVLLVDRARTRRAKDAKRRPPRPRGPTPPG
jgi:hypothetical protein